MALFDDKSRYVRFAEPYETIDRRGRRVLALTPAEPPAQLRLGSHLRKEGQRLDHLASFYLGDGSGFWRLCEHNGALLPDALAESDVVEIPVP
jgi:hypothetical protein